MLHHVLLVQKVADLRRDDSKTYKFKFERRDYLYYGGGKIMSELNTNLLMIYLGSSY